MPYSLIRQRYSDVPGRGRVLGENVYLDKIPQDSKIFVFYFPHESLSYSELEIKLRKYGKESENGIFVNMGKIGSSTYFKMVEDFEIVSLPVIIVTGVQEVAVIETNEGEKTVYAKIDNKTLLNSPNKTMETIAEIVNLFILKKFSLIPQRVRGAERKALLLKIKDQIFEVFRNIKEISFGLTDGVLTLKFNGE